MMTKYQFLFLEISFFELFNGADFSFKEEIAKSNNKNLKPNQDSFNEFVVISEKLFSAIEPVLLLI